MATLYSIIVSIVIRAIIVPWHIILIVIGRFPLEGLHQRLGRPHAPEKKTASRILIHAVSVGEMAAVEPVVRELLNDGLYEFIITTGNKDGLRSAITLQNRFPEIVSVQYLPWDDREILRSWLRQLQPDLAAMVETELWPNLFAVCGELKIPLCLINARIYPHDIQRYRMALPFFQKVLQHVSWIGVQNSREREHFVAIGATVDKVEVVGNIKFDVSPASQPLPDTWLKQFEQVPMLVVAGSTHSPEERWVVESFRQLREIYPSVRLVLAPRHIVRADSIMRMAGKENMRAVCWSKSEADPREWDVLVLDETGWLPAVYGHATVAIVGGSFANHGGHNILEPAAHGCAIITGPHMHHFRDMVEDFQAADAIVRLHTRNQLTHALLELFTAPEKRASMGNNARTLLRSRQGAALLYADAVRERVASIEKPEQEHAR